MPRRFRTVPFPSTGSSSAANPGVQSANPAALTPNEQRRLALQTQTVDASQMRAQNSSLILRLIWDEKTISRAELARRTGLSRSTVSAIVNELIQTGIVAEYGAGHSAGGRRPIIVSVNDDGFGLIGLDIGARHIGVAITNLRGKVIIWEHRRYTVHNDPEGTFALIGSLVESCLGASKLSPERVVGIGVAVPSPVHPKHPDFVSDVIMPAWKGVSILDRLRNMFGVPVYMDNDANLGALAELWWGAGRDGADLAFIKVGKGIGAGFIINGEIYRGSSGFAGEMGLLIIEPSRFRTPDAFEGNLQWYVGADSLESFAAKRLEVHGSSSINGRAITVSDIADAALAGDTVGLEVIEQAGTYLGIAIANVLNLINPATIVLGGALAKAGDPLICAVRQTIRKYTLWEAVADVRLETSQLGEHSIAVGAATQVLKCALNDPSLFPYAKPADAPPPV